jgi:predicted nuclease of predicted toxin-antitoxin system
VPFALDDAGPVVQTGAEIVAEAAAAVAVLIGDDFDASDLTSVEGQIFSVLALLNMDIDKEKDTILYAKFLQVNQMKN